MNSKKNSSVVSLLLLLALVAVGLFWFKPNFDQNSTLKAELQAKENEQQQLQTSLDSLKTAQANLAGSSEITQETILSAIPERFEQNKMIVLLTDIAQKNDINIGSISFSAPFNSQDEVKKATISINMTGSEEDLLKLLRGLENSARKMVIRNITVQFGQTEGLERINFNISLETYFQTGL